VLGWVHQSASRQPHTPSPGELTRFNYFNKKNHCKETKATAINEITKISNQKSKTIASQKKKPSKAKNKKTNLCFA
jgi:hypothetical protein